MSCGSCFQNIVEQLYEISKTCPWHNRSEVRQIPLRWKAIYIGRGNYPPEMFKSIEFKRRISRNCNPSCVCAVSLDSFKNRGSMTPGNSLLFKPALVISRKSIPSRTGWSLSKEPSAARRRLYRHRRRATAKGIDDDDTFQLQQSKQEAKQKYNWGETTSVHT